MQRQVHLRAPHPSDGNYAEVKDLVLRIDPEHNLCEWAEGRGPGQGGGTWYVRMGRYESDFPFRNGYSRFDDLYQPVKGEQFTTDPTTGYRIYRLKKDAVFLLTELMKLEDYRSTLGPPPR